MPDPTLGSGMTPGSNEDSPMTNETRDMNRDPITGAPGSHPLGTGVGATGGAVAGGLVGAPFGPIGMLVGGARGAPAPPWLIKKTQPPRPS